MLENYKTLNQSVDLLDITHKEAVRKISGIFNVRIQV